MISYTEENGNVTPLKFQIKNEEKQYITIKIENITERAEEKLAGNRMFMYKCQSEIEGTIKIFEIKYELTSCRWYLYKM